MQDFITRDLATYSLGSQSITEGATPMHTIERVVRAALWHRTCWAVLSNLRVWARPSTLRCPQCHPSHQAPVMGRRLKNVGGADTMPTSHSSRNTKSTHYHPHYRLFPWRGVSKLTIN